MYAVSAMSRIAFEVSASNGGLAESIGIYFGTPNGAYREYPRQFVETFRPQLLSYDHFAVKGGGDNYFPNLAEIRQAARDADIPFMVIAQACSWTVNMRIPTGRPRTWQR
jgi:hypothetical protein